ncbi:AAA family ATPase [uncultured Draconibacterium sp.]|uniref:AAA family ATPase n=1 Tax=uncultured Draconibacterium sp. TaxID=1573823 RepID=UPI0029C72942|nr:AAA family ATPase [uncultured Draconibacterium sp.]
MRLEKFEAKNVHGYLNYDIDFKGRLTFLIGINGTGKTSVLKLILGLISPSHDYLNNIDFEFIKLTCYDENQSKIEISSKPNDNDGLLLSLKKGNEEPIEGIIEKIPSRIYNQLSYDDRNTKMQSILEHFDNKDVVKEIKELTTPLFLGLDRRVYEGQDIDKMRQNFLFRRRYREFPQNDPLNISLMDIQEIIYDYVRIIASKQPQINQDFKNKILIQSFDFLESQDINLVKDFKELRKKKDEALSAFDNLNIVGFTEQVNSFFDQLEAVLKEIRNRQKNQNQPNEEINIDSIEYFQKWFNNQPQLKRIDKLIEFNQAYQSEIEKLYEPLEKVKSIINQFFSESKKEMLIDSEGTITIKFKNGKEAKLFELSSGEKQIITMLGHLIFFEEKFKKKQGIFIIDEPEVSLHLAWQEIFVKSIMTASPNTQFILATHSPAITNDADEDLYQDLAKMN